MAGEIENSPYTINLQADSLRSGSISFGRFENEALCWERRSSFSRNRYLEEAEKYSRPGSVNEKKAYFEAHFRRRALMKQSSCRSQKGTGCQSSENDFSETMSYDSDNFGSFLERSHSTRFNEYPVIERGFEEPYSATARGTVYAPQNSECDTSKCDRLNMQELQHDEVGNGQFMNNESEMKNLNTEIGKKDTTCKSSNLVEVDDIVNSDMTFDVVDLSESHPHCETVTTASSEHPDDASNKEMTATSRPRDRKLRSKGIKSDRKVVGTQVRRDTPNVETRRATSNLASKNLVGKPAKKEANDIPRVNRDKKAAKPSSPVTKPNRNRLRQEPPHNLKTKPLHLNRSADLESRTVRTVNSLCPSSDNVAHKLNSSVNRPRQAFGSSRPGVKQNDSAVSFKSDERAEKRKEEKLVAEIKQLRKSLNFKAKPIPSFYHESDGGIEKSKGTPSKARPSRPLTRGSSVAGSGTYERSPSCSELGSVGVPSAGGPSNRTRLPHNQEVASSNQAARPRSSSQSSAPGLKTHVRAANPLITKKGLGNDKIQSTQHKDSVLEFEDQPKRTSNREGVQEYRRGR